MDVFFLWLMFTSNLNSRTQVGYLAEGQT